MQIFGKTFSKNELTKRIGDMSQLAGAVPFTYSDGKAKGTAAVEVKNGSGLRLVILPDRGMDIAYAEWRGTPISYISKTGIVSPAHYDEPDFLRSFSAGLLTTCGLTYMGAPCVDEGVSLGAHGRISNTPAYDVGVTQEWEGDDFVIRVRGKVKEAAVFGEHLVLTRVVTVKAGENAVYLHDEIENRGFESRPLMVLYHINFGFPLVSESAVLETNCKNIRPRDAAAKPGLADACRFSGPQHAYREQVFYRDAEGDAYAALRNPELGITAKIGFSGDELPYLIEWKQMGEQEYVVGLEPATYPPDGRAAAREKGELLFLEPGAVKKQSVYFSFSDD